MSYLYRTGNSRNNIAFTTTANSSTKYLRRLGSGRTNINWYTIPQGSTYNILQRNGTGRNNILWSNLNIPKPVGEPSSSTDITGLSFPIYTTSGKQTSNIGGYVTLIMVMEYLGVTSGASPSSPWRDNGVAAGTIVNTGDWYYNYGSVKWTYDQGLDHEVSVSYSPFSSGNITALRNAKKLTLYIGSYWMTMHLSLSSDSSDNDIEFDVTEWNFSEGKSFFDQFKTSTNTGIVARNISDHFGSMSTRGVFNTVW